MAGNSIHWFRKGLRLHDNPNLVEICKTSSKVYPIFIIDPHFANPSIVGVNRYSFLLDSLKDLDISLRNLGSRLFVIRGNPVEKLNHLIDMWSIDALTFEADTEPYARIRDNQIIEDLRSKVHISSYPTHTIFEMEQYLTACKGNIPTTYTSFLKAFENCGKPRTPLEPPSYIPFVSLEELNDSAFNVPSLIEMGYTELPTTTFRGGETEALVRLQGMVVDRPTWVANFEKPNTSPNSLEPSTTVLSPYLKFGCLSAAKFYETLSDIYSATSKHSQPPVSLHGQLLWREFFYFSSFVTPNFDKMEGNDRCKQIPWSRNSEIIEAWKYGRTGYPFIDAIMTQLRVEGWIHHLARHAVACFLTRGDLWQHWEEGVRVFDLFLLDSDWALNNANWQWLSCSNFFYQYFRCYSPIAFGKKTDPEGKYIRKWLPQLANFSSRYIFEPWKAPLSVQRESGCIIGTDYPHPIVDHAIVSKENMNAMKVAYGSHVTLLHVQQDNTEATENNAELSVSNSSISSASTKKRKTSGTIDKFFKKRG